MKIESEDIDIQNFLVGSYFQIPRFQRPFSWEAEHVQEFWDDLIENQKEDYFIGSMVLFKKGKQDYGVVDGQQRLTTITLLLCALRNAFSAVGDEDLARGLHRLIERKNIDNVDSFVLLTESSFPYLQDTIQSFGESQLNIPPTPEEINLSKAFKLLTLQVSRLVESVEIDPLVPEDHKNEAKITKLKSIRDSLLSLKLIQVILDNEDDAYIIFETLNTRGKDLALSDLAKNHFTKLIKKKASVDVVKEKWTEFMETFEQSEADISPNVFITHYWASRYEAVTQKKVYSRLKKTVKRTNAKTYLDSLLTDVKLYRSIYEPTLGWTKNEKKIQDSLSALQIFRLSQQTPATLSLVRAYREKKIKVKKVSEALEAIENFHFVFSAVTSSRSSGGISAMYSSFARKVFESDSSQSASDAIAELKQKLRDRRPSYSEFLVGFEEILFTNSLTKQRNLVRYILQKIGRSRGYGYPVDWADLTIEHIYPQEKIDRAEWTSEVVGQLGNLIFVSEELNGKLSTKAFSAKQKILVASDESFPDYIQLQSKWSPDEVTSHTELLAEEAYGVIWKI